MRPTGDRYDPRGIDTAYMPLDSVSGVGGMRMRCIKGTERYDRKKKGGYSPFSAPKSDAGVKIRLLREF